MSPGFAGDHATGGSAAQQPGGGADGVTVGDVFTAIKDHVERNPDLKKINVVYQFKVGPEVYTVDLKQGTVGAGETAKPECTLELSTQDFVDMTSGKADPQKLYFGGKLKISGNVMASQKLEFLKKMDPEKAKEAVAKARGAGGTTAAATATATATATGRPAQAQAIFGALGERAAKNPNLLKEVGAVLQFKVDGAEWVVDGKAGTVKQGTAPKPDTILTLADEDLVALVKGTEPPQSLHQKGRLRVDGDVRAAHRLGFLKQLV
jgi:3-hydroxyacyl-CoA dehydrogenase/3a,7a,12a-trihydroxy-5b-cholest-24-enoyl-CoA hydratase